MVLTKKELSEKMSDLYREVSEKQSAVYDAHERNHQIAQELWEGYNKVRNHLQEARRALIRVGGIEP